MHRASVNLEQQARWVSVIYDGMDNYISISYVLRKLLWYNDVKGGFRIYRNFPNNWQELLNTKIFIFRLVHCDPG